MFTNRQEKLTAGIVLMILLVAGVRLMFAS